MTSNPDALVFKLLDNYSRERHDCFIAEFFPNAAKTEYNVCFRPVGSDRDSLNRYSCKYLRIGLAEVAALVESEMLNTHIQEMLDRELTQIESK